MKFHRAGRQVRPLAMIASILACLFIIVGDGTSVAGIQGSGFRSNSVGRITRFGSIFVNGIEYDISAAQIRIDGEPGSESLLRVGQVVSVKGEVNAEGTAGDATDVTFTSDVRGPIAQVNLADGSLVILGQRIRILGDTILDGLPLGGILGLVPGIQVQVSGFPNAAGDLVASRIDLVLGGPSNARIKGVVQGLDTTAHTFRVNTQTVNYSGATPIGALANGSTVSVGGSIPSGQTSLHATHVEVISGLGGAANELGQIEGLITAFNSASDFAIGAQRVATDASTQFVLHGQALGPNLAVDVQGTFNAAGVLVARKVQARSAGLLGGLIGGLLGGLTGAPGTGPAGVLGPVESVSASGHSLRVLGVDLQVSGATAFDDQSSQGLRPFGLPELRVGDYVEVRGGALGPGAPLQATVVRRDDAGSNFYLEGAATQLASPGFKVLGAPVMTTSQTRFPGGGLLAPLKFFLLSQNRIVRVQGTLSGHVLVAERIEYVK
jgi:hypothetical protein